MSESCLTEQAAKMRGRIGVVIDKSLSQRVLKKEAQAGGSSSPGQQLVIFWKCGATDTATVPAINAGAHVCHSWRQGLLSGPHLFKEEVSYAREMPPSIMSAVNFINMLFLSMLKPSLALLHQDTSQKKL